MYVNLHKRKYGKISRYDIEGRLSSADCLHLTLDYDMTEKIDSFVIEYEYVSFDNNANWTERKGLVNKKLNVQESRKIIYE